MNASLDLSNASAAFTSLPMQVPPIVSFRSRKIKYDPLECEEGYQWSRFGCLRAIYKAVQKPGSIYKAFGLKPITTTHIPYTLSIAVDKHDKESDKDKFGVWPVGQGKKLKKKPPKTTTESNVFVIGDEDEGTPLPQQGGPDSHSHRKLGWRDIVNT